MGNSRSAELGFNFWSLMLIGILLFGCAGNREDFTAIAYTSVPASVTSESIRDGSYRYLPGQVIKTVETGASIESATIFTEGFYSARAPEISYDGKTMVFSAQKSEGDAWQIWMMDLKKRQAIQVTSSESNCTDPVWLPDGRIAFSKLITENHLTHHALFTIDPDGCCEQRITYQPHDDLNATVMNDGRLLFSSRQLYPEPGPVKYLAMRPDGTKAELFFKPASVNAELGRAIESVDEEIFFAESGAFSKIRFGRPLHSLKKINIGEEVHSAIPYQDGQFICSSKSGDMGRYGLSIIKDHNQAGEGWLSDNSGHLVEPAAIAPRKVPRKLPSPMDMSDPNGYLICMDVSESEIAAASDHPATKVQVLGINKTIGEIPVEQDGSFYLALPADEPLQFQTINEMGEVVNGPSAWIWVRPSESRSCVGCHADREMAPENVVPMAVNKLPVALGNK